MLNIDRVKEINTIKKMCINYDNCIVDYADQQPFLLSDVKREIDSNSITFGGTRQDGTQVLVTINLKENSTVRECLEDFENILTTLAFYCSPTGQKELEKYAR